MILLLLKMLTGEMGGLSSEIHPGTPPAPYSILRSLLPGWIIAACGRIPFITAIGQARVDGGDWYARELAELLPHIARALNMNLG